MIQGPKRASLSDFDSIIELVDECFPDDRDRGGMLARWPHCYIPQHEKIKNCLIFKDGSKVVSLVEYVGQTVFVNGSEVKVAGITGVATWPTYRGRGFMTKLLEYCTYLMHEEGYAFSDLGGDRQRYGRFGWENAGREWRFIVTPRSLQAAEASVGFEVTPYRACSEEIDAIIVIHEQEPLRRKRTRHLYELLLGRKGKQVWLARGQEGIVAYVVTHPNESEQSIVEFGGNPEGIYAILAYLTETLRSGALHIHSPWSHPLNAMFFSISSRWNLGCLRMIKMLNLEATLRGFAPQLGTRYRELGMQERRNVALGIEGTDQQVEIEFSPEAVIVGNPHLPQALTLSEHQMVQLIFGPGSPGTMLALPQKARFLEALLPVNFYLWGNETV
ncbi:GNAT family N-acetyltransferase [Candidatus Poribacteria bacterium]|nr:GNAT family N-acetyltransferase [Candidatus Poribacteria bacterium]